MMADTVRMAAYAEAISASCPGRVVCEIGVGLGPLSLMALHAGAQRVYGIEVDPQVLGLATDVIRSHGFDDTQFIPVEGLSTDVELPEPVDVILSETLDSLGVGENTASYMTDAGARFLKPEGRFLPERLDCYVALAAPEEYGSRERFWVDLDGLGLDYTRVQPSVRGVKHTLVVRPDELLSGFARWQSIDFRNAGSFCQRSPVVLQANKSGLATGLASTFVAVLHKDIVISTFPDAPPTHWKQGFAPFPDRAIELNVGDLAFAEIEIGEHRGPSIEYQLQVAAGPPDRMTRFLKRRLAEMERAA